MDCQVNGTSVKYMGLSIQSTYSATWERTRILNDIIQFMTIERLAICIFGSICGCQMVRENRSLDLTVLWIGEDDLVGRPES